MRTALIHERHREERKLRSDPGTTLWPWMASRFAGLPAAMTANPQRIMIYGG